MLGIGIIGGGRIAPGHAEAVVANTGLLKLAALSSARPARREELAKKFGAPVESDWRDVLKRPDVDAVVIGLPNDQHLPAVEAAAAAGKHILLEKPIALTLAEVDRMIQVTEKAGVKFFVGQTQHFFGMNRAAKAILDSGELGAPVIVTDSWYKPFGLSVRQPWFLDRTTGGGMWFMNGNHMVDRVLWWTGRKAVAVKARIGNPLLKLKADDTSTVQIELDNGLLVTLTHAGYEVGDERWIGEFVLERGMLKVSTFPPGPGLWVARTSAYEPVPFDNRDAMAVQFEAFGQSIRDNTPPAVSALHARHVLEVMLAAEESSRLGREVRLAR